MYVQPDIRLERLKKREYERYGDEILQGGSRYESNKDFLEWAATYDLGTRNGRSLSKHEAWLMNVPCDVIKINNNNNLADSIASVIEAIKEM